MAHIAEAAIRFRVGGTTLIAEASLQPCSLFVEKVPAKAPLMRSIIGLSTWSAINSAEGRPIFNSPRHLPLSPRTSFSRLSKKTPGGDGRRRRLQPGEGRRGGNVCVANGELAPATRGGYPALFSKKLKAVTKHIDRTFFWMSLADPPATASHRERQHTSRRRTTLRCRRIMNTCPMSRACDA
jgi:hypothetical protein